MPQPKILCRDEIRKVDEIAINEYGIPGIVLMENAGAGAASVIHQLAPTGPILILCGKGNNAGDGYVIARHLQLLGRSVQIFSVVAFEELTGDAQTNHHIALKSKIKMHAIQRAADFDSAADAMCIVDCLLGTGATGLLRDNYLNAVDSANTLNSLRIAIDLPTGVDCDSGDLMPTAFRADHTITFVATKPGLLTDQAKPYVGKIHVVGIGAPVDLLRRFNLTIECDSPETS